MKQATLDAAYMDRWMQGFLQRRSLADAMAHAQEQRRLDRGAEAQRFWKHVVGSIGFLQQAEKKMKKKNPPRQGKRILTVPEQHQLRIARDTLKMNDAMARVMGGPSKEEARKIIEALTGKAPPRENPRRERITARDVSATQNANGYWVLSTIKDGYRVQNTYGDYSKREAMREFLAAVNGPRNNPRRPGDDSGWGPGSGYESAGKIKSVAQLKKVATELLKHVHPSSVMASAANSALRSPDFFMARPASQAELLDMHRRYVTPERKGRYENPVKPKRTLRRTAKKRTIIVKGKGRRRSGNPPIGILGNPPADSKYLGKVSYIEYTHGHDGQPYFHHFKPAVFAQVTNDGRVILWHPTNNLWKLFPIP